MKIMIVLGTRPEAIKLASLIKGMKKDKFFKPVIVSTGQHKQILDDVLDLFKIKPDYKLNIFKKKQSLSSITTKVVSKLTPIIEKEGPNFVLVLGDTTTAMAASLAAFNTTTGVIHIESGVRTNEMYNPFPEEMNRRLIDDMSTVFFCQTENDLNTLVKEHKRIMGADRQLAMVVGNTSFDNFERMKLTRKPNKTIIVTFHRRENWHRVKEFRKMIEELASRHLDYSIIITAHPNPMIKKEFEKIQSPNIGLMDAVRYDDFMKMLVKASLVISDSGGIMQETNYFNIPLLIYREHLEYKPSNAFTFDNKEDLLKKTDDLDLLINLATKSHVNMFGDGKSTEKILGFLRGKK